MNATTRPTLEEFLAAPISEVAKIAPKTMIYSPGGSRRQAQFEGIEPWGDEYFQWARKRAIACCDLIFRHGVRYLIMLLLSPDNIREINSRGTKIASQIASSIAGSDSLTDYTRLGWRVRLLGIDSLPELKATAQRLQQATPSPHNHTLYWYCLPDEDAPWNELIALAQKTGVRTRDEAIRALYGEDVPPATLYLTTGRPYFSTEIAPPLLLGNIQSYWNQRVGYSLTETELRTIFYDYAYLRTLGRGEKMTRAKAALAHRKAWQEGPILGLGTQLGPFWYPAPTSIPLADEPGE
jgi:hypothetical protein